MRQTELFSTMRATGTLCVRLGVVLLGTSWLPSLAKAHHDMDGETPMTFVQGLTSGVAHPIIGLDHLAVLLLLGALCGSLKSSAWPVLTFAGTSILGCFLHMNRVTWAHAEVTLALSVMAAGPLGWFIARSGRPGLLAMFGLFGVLHGYAYGETMTGAIAPSIAGYLLGFVAVQLALVGAVTALTARSDKRGSAAPRFGLVGALATACVCVGTLGLWA